MGDEASGVVAFVDVFDGEALEGEVMVGSLERGTDVSDVELEEG